MLQVLSYHGGLAIGQYAYSYSNLSLAIGNFASAELDSFGVAIGNGAAIDSSGAIAIGQSADGDNHGVALGGAASATHHQSVAIGAFSSSSGDNTVSVGDTDSSFYRRMTAVADPINIHDAVNLQYLQNNHYSKAEIDTKLQDYYSKTETDTKLALATKADADSVYTKTETDSKIAEASTSGGEDSGSGDGNGDDVYDEPTKNFTSPNATVAAESRNSVAIGEGANTDANNNIAVGNGATAKYDGSIAIGRGAQALSDPTTAVGDSSYAAGIDSVAYGYNAKADADNQAAAIGANTEATADHAVALGNESVADEEKTVSVGNDSMKRRIVNVAAGQEYNDVVIVGQLADRLAEFKKNMRGEIEKATNEVREESRRGSTLAMALSSLDLRFAPGATKAVSMGTGFYKGNTAIATKYGAKINDTTTFSAGIAFDGEETSATTSVGWSW